MFSTDEAVKEFTDDAAGESFVKFYSVPKEKPTFLRMISALEESIAECFDLSEIGTFVKENEIDKHMTAEDRSKLPKMDLKEKQHLFEFADDSVREINAGECPDNVCNLGMFGCVVI